MSRNSLLKTGIIIWNLGDSNRSRTHGHLIGKQKLNHLAKHGCINKPFWLNG